VKYFFQKKTSAQYRQEAFHTGLLTSDLHASLPCQTLWTDLKGAASKKLARNQYTPNDLKIKVSDVYAAKQE